MKISNITILLVCLFAVYACNSDKEAVAGKEAHEHEHQSEGNTVSITKEQMEAVQIELSSIEQKNLEATVRVNGKLEVPAQNKAAVTSLYEGVLQTILVHPGSEVRKGQIIATVSNTALTEVQQSLISVTAQLKLAQLEYNRQQDLVAGNAAPLKNLQKAQAELSSLQAQLAALKKQLSTLGISPSSVTNGTISSTLSLTAPISGTISDIHAQIGSRIDMATPVAMIVNNSQLHLDLFVYEKDLPSIQKGQVIHFTLTNNPGKEYDAKIFSIGTAFADESQSVPVHADVEGDKNGLIEGMNVTAIISIGTRTAAAIPSAAIVSNGGKDYIFVLTEKEEQDRDHEGAEHNHEEQEHEEGEEHKGHAKDDHATLNFQRIQVVKGATDLGFTEIQPVSALPENARIVTRGAFFIMAKMTNTGGHEH